MSEPIKCDYCGRFIPCKDLEAGRATRYMVTPDSDLTSEEFETTCKRCLTTTPESVESKRE